MARTSLDQHQPQGDTFAALQSPVIDRPHMGAVRSFNEFCEAFRVVHDQYVHWGYREPHPSGMHLDSHYLTSHATTYVSSLHGRVQRTATLIADSPEFGLPLDSAFGSHPGLMALREKGSVAEGSALAAVKNPETRERLDLLSQNHWFISMCEKQNIGHLLLVINPKHLSAWNRQFPQLEVICGEPVAVPHVRDNPGILVAFNTHALSDDLHGPQGEGQSIMIRFMKNNGIRSNLDIPFRLSSEDKKVLLKEYPELRSARTASWLWEKGVAGNF